MVGVAQLVERWIVIPVVVGSIPIVHPIFQKGRLDREIGRLFVLGVEWLGCVWLGCFSASETERRPRGASRAKLAPTSVSSQLCLGIGARSLGGPPRNCVGQAKRSRGWRRQHWP